MREYWTAMATLMGALAFFQGLLHAFAPPELRQAAARLISRITRAFSPYSYFDIVETDGFSPNELYDAVQLYLSSARGGAGNADARLSVSRPKNATAVSFGLAASDRIVDTFSGATAVWEHVVQPRASQAITFRPMPEEKRAFTLRLKKTDRGILPAYLDHIVAAADAVRRRSRDRLLYTNSRDHVPWEPVPFKHPSTFDTLAMDPGRKAEIIADLRDFAGGRDFYERTGRAWKRGYLLYGPPGTGKSSMIAAMANLLEYDIYDLELTMVVNNSDLRKLLMKTTPKSIIVIEDIDCSVDLTKRSTGTSGSSESNITTPAAAFTVDEGRSMTLSGLLNFTDGLWSCCGSERIFVFTTNHVERLDPALLRPGRMDMHIHMSFCTPAAVQILLKNYVGFTHEEFDGGEWEKVIMEIEEIAGEAEMTPAEVSEVLVKSRRRGKRAAAEELLEAMRRRVGKRKEETAAVDGTVDGAGGS